MMMRVINPKPATATTPGVADSPERGGSESPEATRLKKTTQQMSASNRSQRENRTPKNQKTKSRLSDQSSSDLGVATQLGDLV